MSAAGPRRLRQLLGFVILAVSALVVANLRRPTPAVRRAPAAPDAAKQAQRIEGFEYRGYRSRALSATGQLAPQGDQESYVLRADRYEGQEQDELRLGGVDMDFTYVSRGAPGSGKILSDEGSYTPSQQRAVFRGNVHLTTQEGLDLRTSTLIYRGDRGIARSDDFVEFRRKQVSGSSKGIEYKADDGSLDLRSEAFLRIEGDEGQPATEIRGGRARVERGDEEMRFADGVEVVQGRDRLAAERLLLGFSWEEQRIYRVQAVGSVRMDMAAGEPLPGSAGPTAARGPRQLECTRLELGFRPDRSLEQALAVGSARLTTLPGPGDAAERRVLSGDSLSFSFDEAGRLRRVVGQRGSAFEAAPLDAKAGPVRRVRCHTFSAQVEPASGEIRRIDFRQNVVFEQGSRLATGQSARYEREGQRLVLTDSPQLEDSRDGSRLSARSIDLGTLTGDIGARGQVRHTLSGSSGGSGLLGGGEQAAQVTSRLFDYDARSRTASYREQAVLSSGKDEVRAADIRIHEEDGGRRRLVALGGVFSVHHPQPAPGQQQLAPVEARAREMTYEEATQQVVYTGDVTLSQQDLVTVSPGATLTLTPDGRGLLSLVAGEPVEVRQGSRTATGARVTYTPSSQSMLLVGEKVVLREPGREVLGRSLTFHMGDDRILVDGREEERIETVFPKEPPKR